MVDRKGFAEKKNLTRALKKEDKTFLGWAHYLHTFEHLSPEQYDAVVDAGHLGSNDIISHVSDALDRRSDSSTPEDFLKAAEVAWIAAENGHAVSVSARDGHIEVVSHKRPLMLSRYHKKLSMLARSVQDTKSVSVRVDRFFHRANICRAQEFIMPRQWLFDRMETRYRKLYRETHAAKTVFIRKRRALTPRVWA